MPRPVPFEELDNFSTLDLLTELRRRYAVLQHPLRSAAIIGPPGSGRESQAKALRRDWGLCVIDGEEARTSADALHSISEKLSTGQCRRGFALYRFPQTPEEARGLDKMLETDFKENKVFRDYRVVALVSEDSEGLKERSSNKDLYADRVKSWLTSKEGLLPYFTGSGRTVNQVDATKKMKDVSADIAKGLM